MKKTIIILDTNTLISAVIRPYSIPYRAFVKAFSNGTVVYSTETFAEILRVIQKTKFEKYLTTEQKQTFISDFLEAAFHIPNISEQITACRDPKDDKFLSLAVTANADYIVTGDEDLLVLNPFQNIQIIKPIDFLDISL